MRGRSANGQVTVTPRQLEGIIRMAEAFARMRMAENVNMSDVERSINLYEVSVGTIAQTDNGEYDIDKIVSKSSKKGRDLAGAILEVIKQNEDSMKKEELVMSLSGKGWTEAKIIDTIDKMLRETVLISPKNGVVRVL